jgi:hypothetical protein
MVYDLEPVDGGRRLRFKIELSGGMAFRLIETLIRRNLEPEVKDRFARLKRLLEEKQ